MWKSKLKAYEFWKDEWDQSSWSAARNGNVLNKRSKKLHLNYLRAQVSREKKNKFIIWHTGHLKPKGKNLERILFV